jgi:hypothetical protein
MKAAIIVVLAALVVAGCAGPADTSPAESSPESEHPPAPPIAEEMAIDGVAAEVGLEQPQADLLDLGELI